MVADDSYFASVKSEKSLEEIVLGFTDVANQEPLQYPTQHLQRK